MTNIPIGNQYRIAGQYIITCNEDGSVPLNSKVLGVADNGVDTTRLDEMLRRANAYPAMLEALEAFVDRWSKYPKKMTGDDLRIYLDNARAAIAQAREE